MRLAAAVLIGAAAMMAGSSVPVHAAEQPKAEDVGKAVDAADWSYDRLYSSGWSARALIGAEVRGSEGNTIGELEDLVVNPDGTLVGIIVESGGMLDEIGETEFGVPWQEVKISDDMSAVSVPVNKENIDDFNIEDLIPFGAEDESAETAEVKPDRWGATELIDNGVDAPGAAEYGIVEDLIFSRDGKLMAVVVDPDDTIDEGGPYAFPYLKNAYDPVTNAYSAPYTPEESARLQRFDYSTLKGKAAK